MVDYRLRKAEEAEAELEAAEELRALRLAMGGTMSLNVALEFALVVTPSFQFRPEQTSLDCARRP